MTTKKPACRHTPAPTDYLMFHAWAKEKRKTHRQTRCPGCGLWAVWVPKQPKRKKA